MLDLEAGLHSELGTFFDGEGFRFQRFERPRNGQVDCDVGAAGYFEGQGVNDATTGVFGVDRKGRGIADAQRSFPSIERFIVLVYLSG